MLLRLLQSSKVSSNSPDRRGRTKVESQKIRSSKATTKLAAMKYSNFEDLPVWKAAIDFALRVFEFTEKADFRGLGDTRNQLERATVSISNNIAEGFERGSTTDLIYFLYIAKGSAGESRSMLRLCERLPRLLI